MWYITASKHGSETCCVVTGGYNTKEEADSSLHKAQHLANYHYPNDNPCGFGVDWYTMRFDGEKKSIFGAI